MTEEVTQQPSIEEEKAPDAITAFITIKMPDGSYRAITDLSTVFSIARVATLNDIRQGCEELRYTITKADIVNGVIDKLGSAFKSSLQTGGN